MMMQRKQPLAIRKCHKNRPGLGLVMGLGRGFFREEFLAALLAEGLKLLLALRRELRVRHAHHYPGGEAERGGLCWLTFKKRQAVENVRALRSPHGDSLERQQLWRDFSNQCGPCWIAVQDSKVGFKRTSFDQSARRWRQSVREPVRSENLKCAINLRGKASKLRPTAPAARSGICRFPQWFPRNN